MKFRKRIQFRTVIGTSDGIGGGGIYRQKWEPLNRTDSETPILKTRKTANNGNVHTTKSTGSNKNPTPKSKCEQYPPLGKPQEARRDR